MNLEALKTEWKVFDQKIEASQKMTERLVESITREKSLSRLSIIKKQYHGFFAVLFIEFVLLIAILAGNPFDFKYRLQFVPYVLLMAGIALAFFNLVHLYKKVNQPLAERSVGNFLEAILETYEKNKKFEKWFGCVFLSIGLLLPLSFLPQKLDRNPALTAIGETVLMMAITLVLYLLAFRAGAFKNKHSEKLQDYLEEFNELKQMAAELKSNS